MLFEKFTGFLDTLDTSVWLVNTYVMNLQELR